MSQFTLSESEYLLKSWEEYKGNIVCGYSKKSWEAKEMILLSQKIALELLRAGLQEGDNVPILLSNTVAFPITLMALLYIKCNPLLLHVSTNEVDLQKLKKKVPFKFFIHDYIAITSNLILDVKEVVWESQIENISVKLVYEHTPTNKQSLKRRGEILHLTSGTSGSSKICIRNQEVAIAEAINFLSSIHIFDHANVLVTTPLSHAYAYGFGLITSLLSNSNLWIDVSFNPRKILKQMSKVSIDILAIVPVMAKLFIQLGQMFPSNTMAKAVFYAGSSCPPDILVEFEQTFKTKLYAIYGSTETGSIATSFSHMKSLKGVGQIYHDVKVNLVNMEKYEKLREGAGEVVVSSSSMMQGYYESFQNEKIIQHATGDIGYFDQESLFLIGRAKDMINVGGLKIVPNEVEEVLKEFPGIEEVVVYSGRTKEGTEKICCAYYSKEKELNIDQLRAFCSERLSAFKMPRSFYYMEIPRSATGKYLKHLLPDFNTDNYLLENY